MTQTKKPKSDKKDLKEYIEMAEVLLSQIHKLNEEIYLKEVKLKAIKSELTETETYKKFIGNYDALVSASRVLIRDKFLREEKPKFKMGDQVKVASFTSVGDSQVRVYLSGTIHGDATPLLKTDASFEYHVFSYKVMVEGEEVLEIDESKMKKL